MVYLSPFYLLCLLMVLLLSNSTEDAENSTPSQTWNNFNQSRVWLFDPETETCFGIQGFGQCGDVNMWKWLNTDAGMQLEEASVENSQKRLCLNKNKLGHLDLTECESNKPFTTRPIWSYNAETGALSWKSKFSNFLGATCLVNNKDKLLQKCERQWTPLQILRIETNQVNQLDNIQSKGRLENNLGFSEEWKCPETSLTFPGNLDSYLPTKSEEQQVLMGVGLFSLNLVALKLKLYNIAWYVSAKQVIDDMDFLQYKSYSHQQLAERPDFFALMTRPGGFDRSFLLKLAAPLHTEIIVKALGELKMQEKNKAVLLKAIREVYHERLCPVGMEILFTWKQQRLQGAEALEIRFGENMVSLSEAGLSQDLFYQFFRLDDPVSKESLPKFIENFPRLFSGGISSEIRRQEAAAEFRLVEEVGVVGRWWLEVVVLVSFSLACVVVGAHFKSKRPDEDHRSLSFPSNRSWSPQQPQPQQHLALKLTRSTSLLSFDSNS